LKNSGYTPAHTDEVVEKVSDVCSNAPENATDNFQSFEYHIAGNFQRVKFSG